MKVRYKNNYIISIIVKGINKEYNIEYTSILLYLQNVYNVLVKYIGT